MRNRSYFIILETKNIKREEETELLFCFERNENDKEEHFVQLSDSVFIQAW